MSTTLSIKPPDLTWLLAAVIPHAETTGMLPSINAVKIDCDGKNLAATATDRYTLAHSSVQLRDTVEPVSLLLPLQYAKDVLALSRKQRSVDIGLDLDAEKVQVQLAGIGLQDGPRHVFPTRVESDFPKWRDLITKALTDPAQSTGETAASAAIGMSSALLARWSAGAVSRNTALLMTTRDPRKAVLFRSGTPAEDRYFVGMQMPMTLDAGSFDADAWSTWATPSEEAAA